MMDWITRASASSKNTFDSIFKVGQDYPSSSNNIYKVLNTVIEVLLVIAGAIAVIYLMYAGIIYLTAGGNPDQAKKGQQGVINAVIGIIIIAAAWFIVQVAVNIPTNLKTTP